MAYSNKNLSVLAYANGFTLWHYVASVDETIEQITADDYFVQVKTLISTGDIVCINAGNKTAMRAFLYENNRLKLVPLS